MKEQRINTLFLLFMIVSIVGCSKPNYSLKGNWSMISSNRYFEIKVSDSTIRIFQDGFDYWPLDKRYKTENDSLFLKSNREKKYINKYSIVRINDTIFQLRGDRDDMTVIKRNNNDFTFDQIVDSITEMQFQREFNRRLVKTLDSMQIEVPRLNRMLYDQ